MDSFYREYLDVAMDRSGTNCEKWDRCGEHFGRDGLIPMWVADMDFPTVPAVVDARLTLKTLLMELSPEERTLILRRYFQAHTQTAIARDMGVSQVQISRMEGRILKRMRARAEGQPG